MIKKVTVPLIEKLDGCEESIVVGTKVEYRIFGILLYEKSLLLPIYWGIMDWDDFQTRI